MHNPHVTTSPMLSLVRYYLKWGNWAFEPTQTTKNTNATPCANTRDPTHAIRHTDPANRFVSRVPNHAIQRDEPLAIGFKASLHHALQLACSTTRELRSSCTHRDHASCVASRITPGSRASRSRGLARDESAFIASFESEIIPLFAAFEHRN